MKNLLTTSLLVILLSTTAVFAQNVSTTPPTSVKNFLNTGASQSRQGWLGIGTMTSPTATLDVRGVSLMNNLKVLGNAVVGNKLSIGGLWNPTVGNGLKIQGGTLRVSTLGGFNKKTLCTEPTGKLSICNTNEVLDKCSNLTGTQSTLPYTYYEQGTGRKIVVTAPTNSTICTRTGESVKQCSDGFSNDNDGAADAADGNCYVPIMTNPVTNKPADPTLAAKFLATIGRPVLKIGSNWYVYDPLKDSETDGSSQVCGNNTIEAPEQCDDGNTSNTDACTNTCMNAVCGDGHIRAGVEQCDAGVSGSATCGAPGVTNACMTIVLPPAQVCGNGTKEGVEECDMGVNNGTNNSTCNNLCKTIPLISMRTSPVPNFIYSGVQQGLLVSSGLLSTKTLGWNITYSGNFYVVRNHPTFGPITYTVPWSGRLTGASTGQAINSSVIFGTFGQAQSSINLSQYSISGWCINYPLVNGNTLPQSQTNWSLQNIVAINTNTPICP